ncbi:hypothetical protein HDV01_001836 [Terramyces sp. JEL0728]|nr:hypothetical protein HDV01_001836 [Terramyces sp. JEL0728]
MESHELIEEITKYKPDNDFYSLQINPLSHEQLITIQKSLHASFAQELEKHLFLPASLHGLDPQIQQFIQKEFTGDHIGEIIKSAHNKVISGINSLVNSTLNSILEAEIEKKKAELEALQKEHAEKQSVQSEEEVAHNENTNVDTEQTEQERKDADVKASGEPAVSKKPSVTESEKKAEKHDVHTEKDRLPLDEDHPKRKSTFGSGIRNMLGHLTKQRAPKPKKGQSTDDKDEPKVENEAEQSVDKPIEQSLEPKDEEEAVAEQKEHAKENHAVEHQEEDVVVQPKRYVPTNAMSALASAMKSGLGEKVRSHGKSITDLAESRSTESVAQIATRPNPSTKPRPVTMVEMNTAAPPATKPRPTTSVDDNIFLGGDDKENHAEKVAPPVQPRVKSPNADRPISHVGVPVLPTIPNRPISHSDDPPPVQPRIKSPERQGSIDRPNSHVDEPPATLPRPRPSLPERTLSQDRPSSQIEESPVKQSEADPNGDAPHVVPRVRSPQLPNRPISENRPVSTFEVTADPSGLDDDEPHIALTKDEIARNELARKSLARPATTKKPAPAPLAKPLVLKKKENSTSGDDKAIEKKAIEWLNKNLKSHEIELDKLDISDGLTFIYALEVRYFNVEPNWTKCRQVQQKSNDAGA